MTAPALFGKSRIDKSRISAVMDGIGATVQDSVDFVKRYGLRWVELRQVPGSKREYAVASEAECKAALAMLTANGLKVSFLNTSLMKVAPKKEDMEKACTAASILGCDKVGVLTGPRAAGSRIADEIGSMAEVAGSYKVSLAVVATSQEIAEIMRAVPSRWVGYNWNPTSLEEYAVLPKDRMLNVHFGGAKVDWARIVKSLEKDGYKYQIGLDSDAGVEGAHDAMKNMLRIVD